MGIQTPRLRAAKPPKQSRFVKGVSGNPRGRPKGKLNLSTVLDRTLREQVLIERHGKVKTVTKLEAALAQLVDKSTKGNMAALRLLAALVQSSEAAALVPGYSADLLPQDQKVLARLVRRFEKTKGVSDEPFQIPRFKNPVSGEP